jgi:undecaprenyl-diphosphatase
MCLAVVALAWAATTTPAGRSFDTAGVHALQSWPGSDRAWSDASWPGVSAVALVLLGLSALVCVVLRERQLSLVCLAAMLIIPAVQGLKGLLERARPEGALAHGWAFPSGHAANSMVTFGVIAVLLVPLAVARGAPRGLAPAAIGLWLGLTAAVGMARIAAGVHWPTDVLAGWALGGAFVAAAAWAAGRVQEAGRQPDP